MAGLAAMVAAGCLGGEEDEMRSMSKGGARRRNPQDPGVLSLNPLTSSFASLPSDSFLMTPAITVVVDVMLRAWPANGAAMGIVAKANQGVSSSWALRAGSPLGAVTPGDAMSACIFSSLTEAYGNASRVDGSRHSNPPIGIKSQVALVHAAGVTAIYVNANPLLLTTTGSLPANVLGTSLADLVVGAVTISGNRSSFADMEVSNLRVFPSALSQADLVDLATGVSVAGQNVHVPYLVDMHDDGARQLQGTAHGGAVIAGSPHSLFSDVRYMGVFGHSNGRGRITIDGDTESSRGGSRRYAANALAAENVLWVGIGGNPSGGGWSNYHDCVDTSTIQQIRTRIAATIAAGARDLWFWGGINDHRASVPVNTTRTQMRGAMDDMFAEPDTHVYLQQESVDNTANPTNRARLEGFRCFQENQLMIEQRALGRTSRIYFHKPGWNATTHVQPDQLHVTEEGHELNGTSLAPHIIVRSSVPALTPVEERTNALLAALGSSSRFLIDGCFAPVTESGIYAMQVGDRSGNGFNVFAGNNNTLNAMEWTGGGFLAKKGSDDSNYDFMISATAQTNTSGAGGSFACLFDLLDTVQDGVALGACLGTWRHEAAHQSTVLIDSATQTIRFNFDFGLSSGFHRYSVPYVKKLGLSSCHIIWTGGPIDQASSFIGKVHGVTVPVTDVLHTTGSDDANKRLEIGSAGVGTVLQLNGHLRRMSINNVLDATKIDAVDTWLTAHIGAYDT